MKKLLSKKCPTCGLVKPASYFYKEKRKKNGLRYQCIACEKEYQYEHRDKRNSYAKKYREEHKEYFREYEHLPRRKEYQQEYHKWWGATKTGKLSHVRSHYKSLGILDVNFLNEPFPWMDAHLVKSDSNTVVFVPSRIHERAGGGQEMVAHCLRLMKLYGSAENMIKGKPVRILTREKHPKYNYLINVIK